MLMQYKLKLASEHYFSKILQTEDQQLFEQGTRGVRLLSCPDVPNGSGWIQFGGRGIPKRDNLELNTRPLNVAWVSASGYHVKYTSSQNISQICISLSALTGCIRTGYIAISIRFPYTNIVMFSNLHGLSLSKYAKIRTIEESR